MGKASRKKASSGLCKLRKGTFKVAPVTKGTDGSMDLVLPKIDEEELKDALPCVSIITITKDRGAFAGIMLYNWVNIQYPREKLEWVIVDDSSGESTFDLRDYIPYDDKNINYVKLDRWYPVATKRNKAVELAKHDYIVHMDDDDFYFPDSVLAKIRLMLTFKVAGVHSMPIGVYDMMEKSSYIFDPFKESKMDTNDMAEATLAYRKDYWRSHPFASENAEGMGEGRAFVGRRFDQWIKVHFLFNMISITHSKNITGHNRRFINENKDATDTGKFEDIFPEDFKTVLENVRKILATEYVQPNIPLS